LGHTSTPGDLNTTHSLFLSGLKIASSEPKALSLSKYNFGVILMSQDIMEEPQAHARRLKVLLVDDDKFIHEALDLFLRNTEYTMAYATSVKDAIRIIESAKPDIIITDAMMPGESGFCLIERLKSAPETSSIPIILWTILEETNGGVMDASRKADISINKPFYRSDIIGSLEKARRMIESNESFDGLTVRIN
jgi:response regulator RpfG family c-di-GMP phosphodiesterase